jgi:uncharacterized DUF497 family protein
MSDIFISYARSTSSQAHTVAEALRAVTEEEDAGGGSVEVIRIISARRATPRERRRYENENG